MSVPTRSVGRWELERSQRPELNADIHSRLHRVISVMIVVMHLVMIVRMHVRMPVMHVMVRRPVMIVAWKHLMVMRRPVIVRMPAT